VHSGDLPHPSAHHCHLVSIGSGAIGGRRRPSQGAGLLDQFSGRNQLRHKRRISPRTALRLLSVTERCNAPALTRWSIMTRAPIFDIIAERISDNGKPGDPFHVRRFSDAWMRRDILMNYFFVSKATKVGMSRANVGRYARLGLSPDILSVLKLTAR
jgi:hypothetical protein